MVSPSPPPHGANYAQRLEMITTIMDNFIGLVNPYEEVYNLAAHATQIARGGLFRYLILDLYYLYIL